MSQEERMARPVQNLHNHTPFSDGALTIDELVEAHLALRDVQVTSIGICDTLFCTPTSRPVTNERQYHQLFRAEAKEYVSMVREARRRWAGQTQILCGAEIHWALNRSMIVPMRDLIAELELDYVLFSGLDWAGLTQLANQARRFPCPVGLSRTDVSEAFPSTSMDQVVRTLSNARIFWEFTAEMYARRSVGPWCDCLLPHRVRVAVGTDTHDDLSCLKALGPMHEYLAQRNLIDRLLQPEQRPAARPGAAPTSVAAAAG
jgi:hypothetical protein